MNGHLLLSSEIQRHRQQPSGRRPSFLLIAPEKQNPVRGIDLVHPFSFETLLTEYLCHDQPFAEACKEMEVLLDELTTDILPCPGHEDRVGFKADRYLDTWLAGMQEKLTAEILHLSYIGFSGINIDDGKHFCLSIIRSKETFFPGMDSQYYCLGPKQEQKNCGLCIREDDSAEDKPQDIRYSSGSSVVNLIRIVKTKYENKYTNAYRKWRDLLNDDLNDSLSAISEFFLPAPKYAFDCGVSFVFMPDSPGGFAFIQETIYNKDTPYYLEKGDAVIMIHNETNIQAETGDQHRRRQIIRILKFFREFMHVSAQDLVDAIEENKPSRSLIAAVESGNRNPTPEFLRQYADALQNTVKIKRDLIDVAEQCIEDQEFLDLLQKYERGEGGFFNTFRISQKIISISDGKKTKNK